MCFQTCQVRRLCHGSDTPTALYSACEEWVGISRDSQWGVFKRKFCNSRAVTKEQRLAFSSEISRASCASGDGERICPSEGMIWNWIFLTMALLAGWSECISLPIALFCKCWEVFVAQVSVFGSSSGHEWEGLIDETLELMISKIPTASRTQLRVWEFYRKLSQNIRGEKYDVTGYTYKQSTCWLLISQFGY